jgi:hypothetical protein
MKGTNAIPPFSSSFSLSAVSASYLYGSPLRSRKEYSSFQPADQSNQSRMFASEKVRLKKNEVTFRRSVNLDEPVAATSAKKPF